MRRLTVREFLKETYKPKVFFGFSHLVRPHACCADGLELSIQASESHYCYPRATLEDCDSYESVEVMICGEINEYDYKRFMKHSESLDEVAAFVDIDFLELFVFEHGGILVED